MSNENTDTTTEPTGPGDNFLPPAEPEAGDATPDEPGSDDDQQESPNAEAAKWRKRLRETEAERDQLAEQVEALQRQQIEAIVTAAGVKPAAVWATTDVAALVAEDGTVSAEAVTQAIDTARDQLGVQPLGKGGAPVPGIGYRPDGITKTPGQAFTEAFAPKRR